MKLDDFDQNLGNDKNLKIFILKKSDFLTPNLVQVASYTFEMKLALLQKDWT